MGRLYHRWKPRETKGNYRAGARRSNPAARQLCWSCLCPAAEQWREKTREMEGNPPRPHSPPLHCRRSSNSMEKRDVRSRRAASVANPPIRFSSHVCTSTTSSARRAAPYPRCWQLWLDFPLFSSLQGGARKRKAPAAAAAARQTQKPKVRAADIPRILLACSEFIFLH
jgi:hypothetical protein